jgi:hypothetical protein
MIRSQAYGVWAVVAGGIFSGVTVIVLDRLMAVLWPEPWLWTWIRGMLST